MAKRPKLEKIDVEALRAALAAAELRADQATERADEARATADRAEAEAATVRAQLSGDAAPIAHLRLEIARLNRTLYGQRSERTQRLIDQCELQLEEFQLEELELEELEASAAIDALAAEKAAAKAAMPSPAERRKPSRPANGRAPGGAARDHAATRSASAIPAAVAVGNPQREAHYSFRATAQIPFVSIERKSITCFRSASRRRGYEAPRWPGRRPTSSHQLKP